MRVKAGLNRVTAQAGAVKLTQRFGWCGIPAALNLNPIAARRTFTCSFSAASNHRGSSIFYTAYFAAKRLRLPQNVAAPAALIGTSNFSNLQLPWRYLCVVFTLAQRRQWWSGFYWPVCRNWVAME
jgi:hypothetical protein